MKKTMVWTMSLLLALSLTACSGNDTKTTEADTTAAETTASTTEAEPTTTEPASTSSTGAAEEETLSAEELSEFREAVEKYNALSAKEEHLQMTQNIGEGAEVQKVELDATVKQIGEGETAQIEFTGTQTNNGTKTEILLHYKDGVAYLATGGQKVQVASNFASVQQMIGGEYISGVEKIAYSALNREVQADGSVKLTLTISAKEQGVDSGVVEVVIGADGQILSLHAQQEGTITSGTTSMKTTIEMTVEIQNTDDAVKINYPDFSDYLDASAGSETTAAETTAAN
ncbi:hypothetical protein [Hominifimenecus sp. rT4P-3]|uniref:hypothetical protein n=1 Tax=Hominifimenecus sp. rT4P-3 TaxID=3242979 RepID=UPI003DA3FF5F